MSYQETRTKSTTIMWLRLHAHTQTKVTAHSEQRKCKDTATAMLTSSDHKVRHSGHAEQGHLSRSDHPVGLHVSKCPTKPGKSSILPFLCGFDADHLHRPICYSTAGRTQSSRLEISTYLPYLTKVLPIVCKDDSTVRTSPETSRQQRVQYSILFVRYKPQASANVKVSRDDLAAVSRPFVDLWELRSRSLGRDTASRATRRLQ